MSNTKYNKVPALPVNAWEIDSVPALPAPAWEMPPTQPIREQELPNELAVMAMELVVRWCKEDKGMKANQLNWCQAIRHIVTDTLGYEEYTRGWSMNAMDPYKCPACGRGTTHSPKIRY